MNELTEKLKKIEVVTKIENGVIISNLSDFKPLFKAVADSYQNVVYSDNVDEQMRQMKEDRAALNAVKNALDEKRKAVKREYLIPLDAFEDEVKELSDLINNPCKNIDEGYKKLEQERRNRKKTEIRVFFDTQAVVIEDEAYREELFNLIYNPSWENVTSTQKAYKEAITGKIKDYVDGMSALKSMDENFREEGIREFKRSINLTEAVSLMNRLKKQQDELLEKERIRLQQEAEREAQRKIEEEKRKVREEEQRKARLEMEAFKKAEEEKRAAEKEKAAAEAAENERRRAMEEQSKSSKSNEIFIRVINGTITEIYSDIENVKVTVLDEDFAGEQDIFEFEKATQNMNNVEF